MSTELCLSNFCRILAFIILCFEYLATSCNYLTKRRIPYRTSPEQMYLASKVDPLNFSKMWDMSVFPSHLKSLSRDLRFVQIWWPLPLQNSRYMDLSRSCDQMKVTPVALTDECAVTFSQKSVSFFQVWWPQALKNWRSEQLSLVWHKIRPHFQKLVWT